MDNINYDYEIEKHYHPENFEESDDVDAFDLLRMEEENE